MQRQLRTELRHLWKPGSHAAVVPSARRGASGACCTPCPGPTLLRWVCLLAPGMAGQRREQPAPREPQGTPVPSAQAQSSCPAMREAGSHPPEHPSSQPGAPCQQPLGWGWGCGGVSQSGMPIWNPLGTFNPPHPFWCCLSSPPPTHTNAAIQAVNLNKFCPAATSRSDEKAKRSSSKPRGSKKKKRKQERKKEKKRKPLSTAGLIPRKTSCILPSQPAPVLPSRRQSDTMRAV